MNEDALSKIKHKLQAEIDSLEHELNLELPKELMKARAHGDLSENAEYKYAKERQGFVSARLGQLKKRMGDLGMLNLNNIPHDRAGYGSRVWLKDMAKASEIEYKLVTSEEADAAQGLISTTSPIGRALLGRREGDEVQVQTPAGVKRVRVGAAEDDSRGRLAPTSTANELEAPAAVNRRPGRPVRGRPRRSDPRGGHGRINREA